MKQGAGIRDYDWWLLAIVFSICGIGLLEIWSATHTGPLAGMHWRQLWWILLGVAAMLLTGCLRWQDATDALSSKVILIVVASLAIGEAMTATGLIASAGNALALLGNYVPAAAMIAALMLLMGVVTNFVSNNAAAIIGTPVAIAMAASLGVDPRPFVLAVLFGCNMCFATPMAYQTNLLVMSAAGYRFRDFMRAGLPLTVIMWITLTWLLAREYALI